jgi:hypothetical protein
MPYFFPLNQFTIHYSQFTKNKKVRFENRILRIERLRFRGKIKESFLNLKDFFIFSGDETAGIEFARGEQARQRRTSSPEANKLYPPQAGRVREYNSVSHLRPCPDFRNFSRCRAVL